MARNKKSPIPTSTNVLAIMAIVATLGIFCGIAYLNVRGGNERAALDAVSLCPKTGPTSTVIVLIDRTDMLNAIQAEALRRRISMWSKEVPKHGEFKVYEIGKAGELLTPVVSVCNPGDGSDKSIIDSSPEKWRKRYEEKFTTPIDTMLRGMQFDVEAAQSPILEAVQAVSVENFGPDSSVKDRKLILVSDLLQFVPSFSLYKPSPDIDSFRKSSYGASTLSDLSDVEVDIEMIGRTNARALQNEDLGRFWIQWFEGQGAAIDKFGHIPG